MSFTLVCMSLILSWGSIKCPAQALAPDTSTKGMLDGKLLPRVCDRHAVTSVPRPDRMKRVMFWDRTVQPCAGPSTRCVNSMINRSEKTCPVISFLTHGDKNLCSTGPLRSSEGTSRLPPNVELWEPTRVAWQWTRTFGYSENNPGESREIRMIRFWVAVWFRWIFEAAVCRGWLTDHAWLRFYGVWNGPGNYFLSAPFKGCRLILACGPKYYQV